MSTAAIHSATEKPRILFFCQHTASVSVRSGVQRVVVELARELMLQAHVDFVKWDDMDGQLRLADRSDLRAIFGTLTMPNARCHRSAARFDTCVDDPRQTWLIYPEIPAHLPDGNEKFSRIVSQCREYGMRVAAVFYDLIPVREAAYAAGRPSHLKYMAELVRCDLILPISRFAAEDLLSYYSNDAKLVEQELAHMRAIVASVPLGEYTRFEEWARHVATPPADAQYAQPRLIMVGTVEPRKQQTRLLRVLNEGRALHPILRQLEVHIFGSLHPDSSEELWREVGKNPAIHFHHYASESAIQSAYENASFSAFPSLNEGYGLPIVESLRRGVPCLTSNFGAMLEVASGGGCLTVDTTDDAAILRGLVALASDAGLRCRLGGEIASRSRRSWTDYCADVLSRISESHNERQETDRVFTEVVCRWRQSLQPVEATAVLGDKTWRLLTLTSDDKPDLSETDPSSGLIVRVPAQLDFSSWPPQQFERLARADRLILDEESQRSQIAEAANRAKLNIALPTSIVSKAANGKLLAEQLLDFARADAQARRVAFVERIYGHASAAAPVAEGGMNDLAIVISTYNRGPFVEANVVWLLRQIDEHSLPVKCVVVDNASTDDTSQRLQRFLGHPNFDYLCNSANTGMLGNLRVCSSKIVARYVWVTGDDDFIAPGAIRRTLDAIARHPGVPLIVHNFGVYHRERLTVGDSPEMFFRELQPLASNASASGRYPVYQIAAEHDNLFTAIYPLVFRSDLLAACFNHMFDGVPFSNLVECIPTTKFILRTLAHAEAIWMQEIGIVGNAHNSWSDHRPRWHLVLMPEALQLAQQSKVDPQRLWEWASAHLGLFREAVDIAVSRDIKAHLVDPDDFAAASYFFRETIAPPQGLRLGLSSAEWSPPRPYHS